MGKRRNLFIIVMTLIVLFLTSNTVFGTLVDKFGSSIDASVGETQIDEVSDKVINVTSVVGTIISVAIIGILGIKYMVGSVEERAEYKKAMFPYLIGAILLFGVTNIHSIIVRLANSITQSAEIESVGGRVLGVIRVIGTIVSVGMIMVLGIKYMIGSAEERAEYKKTMLAYLIGAVLLFGGVSITDIIYKTANSEIEYKIIRYTCGTCTIPGATAITYSEDVFQISDVYCDNCGALLYDAGKGEKTSSCTSLYFSK